MSRYYFLQIENRRSLNNIKKIENYSLNFFILISLTSYLAIVVLSKNLSFSKRTHGVPSPLENSYLFDPKYTEDQKN